MTDQTKTAPAIVWLPSQMVSDAAPREARQFIDATGKPWVRWWYPGFPNTGGSVPKRSFQSWVRRNLAKDVTNG